MSNCFCVGKQPGCTCDGACRCACTCGSIKDKDFSEFSDWMVEVDKYEGQAVHRTKGGKGVVGRAAAKNRIPNCS